MTFDKTNSKIDASPPVLQTALQVRAAPPARQAQIDSLQSALQSRLDALQTQFDELSGTLTTSKKSQSFFDAELDRIRVLEASCTASEKAVDDLAKWRSEQDHRRTKEKYAEEEIVERVAALSEVAIAKALGGLDTAYVREETW